MGLADNPDAKITRSSSPNTAAKADKYDARVVDDLARGRMSSEDCRKLSGAIDYVCSVGAGRKGRAYAKPIRHWKTFTAAGGAYVSIAASDPKISEWLEYASAEQRINECESIAALLAVASFCQQI